ncbi:MAG: type II secretion system F family protein [Candidatus Geothermincolia bacterium]
MIALLSILCAAALFSCLEPVSRLPLGRLPLAVDASDPVERPHGGATPRRRLLTRLARLARRLPLSPRAELLRRAGSDYSESEFTGARLAWAAGITVLLISRDARLVLFAPLAFALGLHIPVLRLKRLAGRRTRVVAASLPEFMDHLALLMMAGQSLGASLQQAAAVGSGPLYDEIRECLRRTELGSPRSETLSAMAARSPSPPLRRACRALSHAERFGGPVAASIADMAADLRAARLQAAREAASRTPIKLLFPLVFLILPSFILLTVGGFVLTALAR